MQLFSQISRERVYPAIFQVSEHYCGINPLPTVGRGMGIYVFVGFLFVILASVSWSQGVSEPLVPEQTGIEHSIETVRLKWEREGFEAALENGYYGVAANLVSRLLAQENLSDEDRALFLNHQLKIALIRGDMALASEAYGALEKDNLQKDLLLESFYLFFSGNKKGAEQSLAKIERPLVGAEVAAWIHLLEALILSREGATDAANEAFLLAEELAPTAFLRDQFEIVRFREEVAAGEVDVATVSALRETVRSMAGERGGIEAARLLALALNRLGEQEEAIEVLGNQLSLPELREFNLRSEFLILLGMIAGPDSIRGGLALREVISGEGSLQQQSVALTLLFQS